MSNQTTPVQSWEILSAAKKRLGNRGLQDSFGVGERQIDRYCANPVIEEQRDPLERMRLFLSDLRDAGEPELVDAALALLAESCGRVVLSVGVNAPRGLDRIRAALDVHRAVQELVEPCRAGLHPNLADVQAGKLVEATWIYADVYRREFEKNVDVRFAAGFQDEKAAGFAARTAKPAPLWKRAVSLFSLRRVR